MKLNIRGKNLSVTPAIKEYIEKKLNNLDKYFKDGDNTIVFNNGSYLTSKIYYNSRNGDIYPIANEVINNEYITKRVEYADEIINISNDIITYDLLKEMDN